MLGHRASCIVAVVVVAAVGAGCGAVRHASAQTQVIGAGRTIAGTDFIAKAVPRPSTASAFGEEEPQSTCPLIVEIAESQRELRRTVCYSRLESPVRPTIECAHGVTAIYMMVSRASRAVRLGLKNGQSVKVPLFYVPKRLGGPARIFYEATVDPVTVLSVTELLPGGKAITTEAPASSECRRPLVTRLHVPSTVLARGVAPGKRRFTIRPDDAIILGKVYDGLEVSFSRTHKSVGTPALRIAQPASSATITNPTELAKLTPLEWEFADICGMRPYVVIFGWLHVRSDSVFVLGRGSTKLERVATPFGSVVYGIVSRRVTRLVARDAGGHIVVDESIGRDIRTAPCAWGVA